MQYTNVFFKFLPSPDFQISLGICFDSLHFEAGIDVSSFWKNLKRSVCYGRNNPKYDPSAHCFSVIESTVARFEKGFT